MVSGPSMRVTADTSIVQLKSFADSLEDGQRLKGKQNKDGSITLYAATGEPSLMSKITGKAEKRQAAVKDAVLLMLTPKADLLGNKAVGDAGALFGAKAARPSTEGLKAAADFMATIEKGGLARQQGSESPGLGELPLTARADIRDSAKALGTLMGAQNRDPQAYGAEVDKMADALMKGLGTDPTASLYPKAILSDGAALIQGIKAQILEHAGGGLGKAGEDVAQSLAEQVFRSASDRFLGGSPVPGSTDVVIGGKTYERREMLGSPGGFGTAYRYEAKDGSGSIAVKFQNADTADNAESFRQEIVAHKRAGASGHENVLGFKGAMRLEGGGFAIASELATGGEVSSAIPKILQAIKDGTITPEQGLAVQLTLLKDLAQGLGDMHGTAKMTHLDFKPGNAFITGDGKAKVADFGTGVLGEAPVLTDAAAIQNPIWQDGAVLGGVGLIKDRFETNAGAKADEFAATFFPKGVDKDGHIDMKLMEDAYGNRAAKFLSNLGADYVEVEKDEVLSQSGFDGMAYDMFALGVTGVGLLTGDSELTPDQKAASFMTDVSDMQVEFVSAGKLLIGDHEGAARPSTGNRDVDDLLNTLTHPDPWKRPHDANALLDMPAFKLPNVGSDQARQLLMGILNGDANLIKDASDRFV